MEPMMEQVEEYRDAIRAFLGRAEHARALRAIDELRVVRHAQNDVAGLYEVIELARSVPSDIRIGRRGPRAADVVLDTEANIRDLGRRNAEALGQPYRDPFAEPASANAVPLVVSSTNRRKDILAAIVVLLSGTIGGLVGGLLSAYGWDFAPEEAERFATETVVLYSIVGVVVGAFCGGALVALVVAARTLLDAGSSQRRGRSRAG